MTITPNIALQPTSPASPSPRLSAKTLGGCELPPAGCLSRDPVTGQLRGDFTRVGFSEPATVFPTS